VTALEEQGVLITNKDLYIELRKVGDKVNEMVPQALQVADHEKRIRKIERWIWSIPSSLIISMAAVAVAYLETHR
jgi:hypothetical protein